VADACSLVAGSGFFIVEGSGSLNSARAEFSGDEARIEGIARAKYSLEYLSKFIKAGKISDKVQVNFSDDYPLRLDFAGEKMGIGFILAPRVEND
jgi:DNA polymerase III sliding clamp (beta) subunit (PCNA family)